MSDYIDWSKCRTCRGTGEMTEAMHAHLAWIAAGCWPPIRDTPVEKCSSHK